MSQPTSRRVVGRQPGAAVRARVTRAPTAPEENSRGRARTMRSSKGERRVFRSSVGIASFGPFGRAPIAAAGYVRRLRRRASPSVIPKPPPLRAASRI